MYNRGKLSGFGWGLAGKYEYTKHTEPVPYTAVSVRIILNYCNKYIFRLLFFIFLVIYENRANVS